MKTRFDVSGVWVTASGEIKTLKEMSTPHLLNTVRMLASKPSKALSIIIEDIESAAGCDAVWSPRRMDTRRESIKNVTSMSAEDLTAYVLDTPLFKSMLSELAERGVDTENMMSLYSNPDF